MPSIADYRAKFPSLRDLDDNALIGRVAEVQGVGREDVMAHMGYNPSDLTRGFKESFQQLPQLGYGAMAGVGAAGEVALGSGGIMSGIKKAGVEGFNRWGEKIDAGSRESDSFSYSYDQAKEGNFGALVDWLQHGLGYTAGQGLQALASAGIGAVGGKVVIGEAAKDIAKGMVMKEAAAIGATAEGKALAKDVLIGQATKNVASKIGQAVGVGAMAFGQEGGEIFGDLTAQAEKDGRELSGAELGKALGATIAAGGLEFVGDKLGLDIVMGKSALLKPAGAMAGLGGRAARGAIAAAGAAPIEAGTEYLQTGLEEFGKGKEASILPFNQSDDARKGAFDAAMLGGLGGAAVGGGGGLMSAARAKQAQADKGMADLSAATDADSAVAAFTAATDVPLTMPGSIMDKALGPDRAKQLDGQALIEKLPAGRASAGMQSNARLRGADAIAEIRQLDPEQQTEALGLMQTVGRQDLPGHVRRYAQNRLDELLLPVRQVPAGETTELQPDETINADVAFMKFRSPQQIAEDGMPRLPTGETEEFEQIPTGEAIEADPIPAGEATDYDPPAGMVPRTPRADAVAIDPAAPNAVAGYIARVASINTPQARAFVQDYKAGRITNDDVLALLVPNRRADPTADERIAAAAAQAPAQPGTTLLLTGGGMPYGTKSGAAGRATKEGGTVVSVQGGWAVEVPSTEKAPDVAVADVPGSTRLAADPADGGSNQRGGSGGTVGRVADDGRAQPLDAGLPAPATSGNADQVAGSSTGNADPALTPGQRVTLQGKTWTVIDSTPAGVKLDDGAGTKRMVTPTSKTWSQIVKEPNAQPVATAPRVEAPAAPAATTAIAVAAPAGPAAVEGGGLTAGTSRRNVVVRDVRTRNGDKLGDIVEPHDGTKEGIRKAAEKATQRMYDEYPDAGNMMSRIGATDETGRAAWAISPNLDHINPIDSLEGQSTFGNPDAISRVHGPHSWGLGMFMRGERALGRGASDKVLTERHLDLIEQALKDGNPVTAEALAEHSSVNAKKWPLVAARKAAPAITNAAAPASTQAPAQAGEPVAAAPKPKVFKTRQQAQVASKLSGNTKRVKKIAGGFILRDATDKELAAAEKAGKRLQARKMVDPAADPLLTAIAKLGGLAMTERADTIGEGNKLTKGGHVFRNGGQPIDIMAGDLADLNYIPAGEVERDDGVTWLRDAIKAEHMGTRTHYSERNDSWLEDAQAAAQAQYDTDPLSSLELADLQDAGYTGAPAEVQEATERLLADAESQGLDTEAIRERVAMQSEGLTEDEYHAELQAAISEALAQDRRGAQGIDASPAGAGDANRGQVDGGQGEEQGREGLTLSAQTREDLQAKADREEAAAKAERAKKTAEQERLRKEAEQRDIKARADATVDDFQLGQDANAQMSGMGDMFADQPAAPAEKSSDDYLAELFGTPAEQEAAQAKFTADAAAKQRELAGIRSAIGDEAKRAYDERDDWANRVYKANRNRVDLQGDGPSSQESLSIGGINENRRRAAVDALTQEINALKKLSDAVSTDAGAERVLANMRSLMDKAQKAAESGNWPGQSAGDLFQSMLLDDLKMRGPGGKGNVTSNGLSKAMLAAIQPKPAASDLASAAPQSNPVEAWQTEIPTQGLPVQAGDGTVDGSRRVVERIGKDAADAITQNQRLNSQTLYAYLLPSNEERHAIARLFPDDQVPPAPWRLMTPDRFSIGFMTPAQIAAKVAGSTQSLPVLAYGKDHPTANIPEGIVSRVRSAMQGLKAIDDELAQVKRYGGPVELANRLRDRTAAIESGKDVLAKFRKAAKGNGTDAAALIAELGGEPDFKKYSAPAETPAAPAPEAAAEPTPAKQAPKSFRKTHKVKTAVFMEETGTFAEQEVDAETALKALDADIAELDSFRKCITGG